MAVMDDLNREKMSIVVVGHVDHGKSTVIGRLLADTNSLPQGKLEQVKANCERNSRPFEYAYLIDALKDEQAQNITIDSARVFFKSQKRNYIINDAPGHIEFVKNMVTGASRAEAALLVIDALEGVQENSRRHGYLLWMLGIHKIVVLINKMDLVDYAQATFDAVRDEYNHFLDNIGIKPHCYIPVSGRMGDSIAALGTNMPWYQGDTVLTALDTFEKEKPLLDKPFRMCVQDIYRFTQFGDDRRIVGGRVASGSLKAGDELIFYPSAKQSRVKSIEAFGDPAPQIVESGRSTGFTLAEQIYIQRGEVAVRADELQPLVARRLRVSLFWLGRSPLVPKKQYVFKLGTVKVKMTVEKILSVMDASDYSTQAEAAQVGHHDVAECVFLLNRPIAFDLPQTLGETSRFVIVDDFDICGGGIVLEKIADEQQWVRDGVLVRDQKWIKSDITIVQRAQKFSQRPTLVIITGEKGVGRKRLAAALEKNLFEDGRFVYFLGIGSVLYGVDADLTRKDQQDNRSEHIRRLAEIAHIFLDAGMILIVTAVELGKEDQEIIRAVIGSNRTETIWIGDKITTDLDFDLQVPGGDQIESSAVQLKRLLQDHGIIFSP